MPGRVAELAIVTALAAALTLVIAAPVLRAPSERVFGMEIVGRHHDPFTMMERLERSPGLDLHAQPVTDASGALLARLVGGVAAYNWLVLLSFPLAAATAYLLARHLDLSFAAAALVAIFYAFSPFHIAHAAYHPHIAQTQWTPLYLLALWRCLDRPSPAAVALLALAAATVTLSNFYGGLIAAVITPAAAGAYWWVTRMRAARPVWRLGVTMIGLALVASLAVVLVSLAAPAIMTDRAVAAFPRADLFHYSARWWSYLAPPVEHPLLGASMRTLWQRVGVGDGLLEQQVTIGWGIIALALIAIHRWLTGERQPAALVAVPVLVLVAITALVCSLSPEQAIGGFTLLRPSALLYDIVPMFRGYARFGVVVQLMAVLLAGLGIDRLLRSGTTRGRIACGVLIALAASEYVVAPSNQWRDVLPTQAHRWLMQQAGPVRALDCMPLTQETESVQWLTGGRVTPRSGAADDCGEPNLPQKLAANSYTHLLVRPGGFAQRALLGRPPAGLRVAAHFADGVVLAVTAPVPAIYTEAMTGLSSREHDAARSWRWMSDGSAAWRIVNTRDRLVLARLELELWAFDRPRFMEVRLDGRQVDALLVTPDRRVYRVGALPVLPGHHQLSFHAIETPTAAALRDGADQRPLSFAFGTWGWAVRGEGW